MLTITYPQIRIVSLTDRVVFHCEHHYRDLSKDVMQLRSLIELDLYAIQNQFKNIQFFQRYPYALSDLHFYPPLMADRVVLKLLDWLKNKSYSIDEIQFRIEMLVETDENIKGQSHLAMAIWHPKDHVDSYLPGSVFKSYMTPLYVCGIDGIRNQHLVSNAFSFIFPIIKAPTVLFQSVQEGESTHIQQRALFYVEEIISHYLSWYDEVLFPSLKANYLRWVQSNQIKISLSEEDMDNRCRNFRTKLNKHLIQQFNRVQEDPNSMQSILAVVMHPPNPHDIEKDPFLVLEFTEILYKKEGGSVAKTLETTGNLIQPSNYIPSPMEQYRSLH